MHHFLVSFFEARAALVCPRWPSATFWALLHKKADELHEFVDDGFTVKDTTNYIKLGEKSFIGLKNFKAEFFVVFHRTGSKFARYHYNSFNSLFIYHYFSLFIYLDIIYQEILRCIAR